MFLIIEFSWGPLASTSTWIGGQSRGLRRGLNAAWLAAMVWNSGERKNAALSSSNDRDCWIWARRTASFSGSRPRSSRYAVLTSSIETTVVLHSRLMFDAEFHEVVTCSK